MLQDDTRQDVERRRARSLESDARQIGFKVDVEVAHGFRSRRNLAQ